MWVLGLHKVHGEESIVVLLVHGELLLLLCSTSSMVHLGYSLAHSHQPIDSPLLLPLHSQSHHFLLHWRPSLLLNKVHSNLKLSLLTLTTNGSFLFLVLLSSLNLSLSDSPQSRHILCIRLFHP
ncbi:unnamed protein product [Microthlaspi erraticum]|uniref:Uncharacterized protein n=1 Tax=Microthlaspi erraticum TaxID=1685480 RepID=A0A6D2KZW4_9BRAS|nr:unnamed protein product [Microthlaspi erraticum]